MCLQPLITVVRTSFSTIEHLRYDVFEFHVVIYIWDAHDCLKPATAHIEL